MLARLRLLLFVFPSVALMPHSLAAQHQAKSASPGPRIEATVAGIRPAGATETAPTQVRRSNSLGRPAAMMVVGGTAVVLGMLIGGDIGMLFMIGGAVALLYGMYQYLR